MRIQGTPDLKWSCAWHPLSCTWYCSLTELNTVVLGSRGHPLCFATTQPFWVIRNILDWGTAFCLGRWRIPWAGFWVCLQSACRLYFFAIWYLHRDASALLDPMECSDMAEEQRVHSPPASLVPRIHVILAQKLQHINPLLPTCLNKEESRTCKCKCWAHEWQAVSPPCGP